MNRRQRMRASNKMARQWLLENKYDQIWLKPHTKNKDTVYCKFGNYQATDLWNLFDGICFNWYGMIVFLQVKTNAWAKDSEYEYFCQDHQCRIVSINVTNKLKECNGKYKVKVRTY